MDHEQTAPATHHVRDAATRAVGAAGMAAIGLIHLLDAPGKLAETPYMFWMYLGLMAASVLVAGELIRTGSRRAWAAAVALALSAAAGFTLTRTVGLPQAHGDIGNWTEPLGLASLWVEGCVAALGTLVLATDARLRRVARLTPATA